MKTTLISIEKSIVSSRVRDTEREAQCDRGAQFTVGVPNITQVGEMLGDLTKADPIPAKTIIQTNDASGDEPCFLLGGVQKQLTQD